jgi:hypothetical protein
MQYFLLLLFTLTSYFLCCRLLSDFFLPPSNNLPCTYQMLSSIMKDIGMEYQVIDAFYNDRIICYEQYTSEMKCTQCQISRYRTDQVTKKVPHKVLPHISIIPCLQQLFRCESIAQFMDYHAQHISEYGVLRMLADAFASRNIEERWPIFKEEPCNFRFSLVVDGVNPFGELRSIYSVWPIFVIKNNLPPWMSIKRENIMLAMIVRGICLKYL